MISPTRRRKSSLPQIPNSNFPIPNKSQIPISKIEDGAKPRDLEDRTLLFAQSASWGAQAASLQSSAACRRHKSAAKAFDFECSKVFSASCRKEQAAVCAPQVSQEWIGNL